MAVRPQYRLLSARGIALPLAITAGAFALLPVFGGLPLPSLTRAPAAAQPPSDPVRVAQEVVVPNASRGCRWQHSADPRVQIADCGDETEAVRVVFEGGRATEYRLIARQDPNRAPSGAQTHAQMSAVAGIVSTQQPSQPGRSLPSSGAPLRVTPNAGG